MTGSGNFSTKLCRPIENALLYNSPRVLVMSAHSMYLYHVKLIRKIHLSVCCIKQTCGQSVSIDHNCTKHIQYFGNCSEAFLTNPFTNILSMRTHPYWPLWPRRLLKEVSACGYSSLHCCTRYTLLPQIKTSQI